MSRGAALKITALWAAFCAAVAGVVMSVFPRVMAICPYEPPSLAKECRDYVWSVSTRFAIDGAWKGALFGIAIGALIVYWKSRKS